MQIVWDPKDKKWINKDEDSTEQEAFKPPPKMADIMPQRSVTPQQPTQFQNAQPQIPQQQQHHQFSQQPESLTPQVSQPQQPSPMHNQQIQQQPQQPVMNEAAPMNPSANPPAPNMFKMQKRSKILLISEDLIGFFDNLIPFQPSKNRT